MNKHILFFILSCAKALRIDPSHKSELRVTKTKSKMKEAEVLHMFNHDEDMENGEAKALARALSSFDFGESDMEFLDSKKHMTSRQKAMWWLAAKEEQQLGNLKDLKDVSEFGKGMAKVPRSWVEAIQKLDHNKTHKFMFSGSVADEHEVNRKWLDGFVRKNFGSEDYYRATNPNTGYRPLGDFDKSLTHQNGYRPKEHGSSDVKYDDSYWQAMAQSKFVLCPGGDRPWSYRFYETPATMAIPVINSLKTDWNHPSRSELIDKIKYEYKTTSDKLEYDTSMAERNYAKFIKYQTFINGDNQL